MPGAYSIYIPTDGWLYIVYGAGACILYKQQAKILTKSNNNKKLRSSPWRPQEEKRSTNNIHNGPKPRGSLYSKSDWMRSATAG
jgi:hypothetical protein